MVFFDTIWDPDLECAFNWWIYWSYFPLTIPCWGGLNAINLQYFFSGQLTPWKNRLLCGIFCFLEILYCRELRCACASWMSLVLVLHGYAYIPIFVQIEKFIYVKTWGWPYHMSCPRTGTFGRGSVSDNLPPHVMMGLPEELTLHCCAHRHKMTCGVGPLAHTMIDILEKSLEPWWQLQCILLQWFWQARPTSGKQLGSCSSLWPKPVGDC